MSGSGRFSSRGPTAAGASVGSPAGHAIIVGGSDETRLLLRGLLRLHRFEVEREVPVDRPLPAAGPGAERWVLLLVVERPTEEWPGELAAALARQPGLRALLIAPEAATNLEARARSAGAHGVLYRPFGIRDLVAAVEAIGRGEERFGTPAPQP